MRTQTKVAEATALQFARALAQRDYERAYELMTADHQARTSVSEVQAAFESIIPLDWGPIELLAGDQVLDEWPDKQPGDVGWVYVGLVGDVYPYSEGLFILISQEGEALKVRDVVFGRP